MQITFIAPGSRGDVQPYVALGQGFKQAGHAVRILAHAEFRGLAEAHGLAFFDMGGNVQDEARQMQALLEKGQTLKIMAAMGRSANQLMHQALVSGLSACEGVDVIMGGLGGLFAGLDLAEKLDLPFIQAHLLPLTPTREFPGVLMPPTPVALPGWANHLSHRLTQQLLWQPFRAPSNKARARAMGMGPAPFWGPFAALQRQARPVLYGCSPLVMPPPADWPANIHMTGYWFLPPPACWEPPADLTAFLDAGPPPVYVGFGSMPSSRPQEAAAMVLQALARAGQRGLLLAGWGGLKAGDLPDTVFMLDYLPHDWLFPRMAAVVHHGGAGTTAAGLRSGVPSIITPFFGDQPYWGRRVHALGVGPRPILRRSLTAANLAQAIDRALTDDAMRQAAASLGARIRAEDGVARAVEIVERHIN